MRTKPPKSHSRRNVLTTAVLLTGMTLSACSSGGPDSDYCKTLKKSQDTLEAFRPGDLDKAFAAIHELSDKAPGDVEDDWQRLEGETDKVESAMKKAGLTVADFVKIQQGKLVSGVDAADLQVVATAIAGLTSDELTKASRSIQSHASKDCEIPLDMF